MKHSTMRQGLAAITLSALAIGSLAGCGRTDSAVDGNATNDTIAETATGEIGRADRA